MVFNRFLIAAITGTVFAAVLCPAQEPLKTTHVTQVDERLLTPEDGLLLGNGDLSVSVYQTVDCIIWRFGKGDVWDRRVDYSDDPKPANIDEIAKGILVEGWKCPPYGGGPVEATRGTDNPQRMKELCQGTPPSYLKRPYPCPKPVGELALQLPSDQMGLAIHQELHIEEATLYITCTWPSGVRLVLSCFIPPKPNVLVVKWKVEGWTPETLTGNNVPPVWFSLYRWADPDIKTFAVKFQGDYRHDGFRMCADPKATPLAPPTLQTDEGTTFIDQAFAADVTFPDGFRCDVTPFAPGLTIQPIDMSPTGEARLHLMPAPDVHAGSLVVSVTTTSDSGGSIEELRRIRTTLADKP
ncbi:MAG: hypothetical protein WC655_21735, partial [Candidatus Hydrogenedentales bacterium]